MRLETPGHIGMETHRLAEAVNSRLRPPRSEPKARIECVGIEPFCKGSPLGSTTMSERSQTGRVAARATGSAYCKPVPAIRAAGCQGSCTPVVMTPAAPAAADTRIAAPMLRRFLGFSSKTTGAGAGLVNTSMSDTVGRSAIAITPVGGGTGASCSKTLSGTTLTYFSKSIATSGAKFSPKPINASTFKLTTSIS